MAGSGFDLPEPIQAISNAADELFDIEDNQKTLKEQRTKAEASVMGLMRAAKRTIYKYRDRTIRIEGKEKLKIQAPKKRIVRKKSAV
jgi:hypothetical protein